MNWREAYEGPLIRLPFLRDKRAEREYPPDMNVLRLWPGLPDAPESGWFKPVDYPLGPRKASRYLCELEGLDADFLRGAQNRALAGENKNSRRERDELEDLRHFEVGGETAVQGQREAAARLEAQKFLLWIWLAQGRAAEIALLAEKFAQSAAEFTRILAKGEDEAPEPLDGSLALDDSIWPSWQSVLTNALYFLPEGTAIFAEGQMRRELLQGLEFAETDCGGIYCSQAKVADLLEREERKLPPSHKRKLTVLVFG